MQRLDTMKRSDKVQMIISKSLPFVLRYGTLLVITALAIIFILLYEIPYIKKYTYKVKIDNLNANEYRFSSINNTPLPTLYHGQRILVTAYADSKTYYDFYIDDIKYIDTCQLEFISIDNTQNHNIETHTYNMIITKTEKPILQKVFGRR